MSKEKKYTIGLLIDWSEDTYHSQVMDGVIEAVRRLGVNLYIFVGGCIHSPRLWEQPRNIIYDLVNPSVFDGLVISAGSVGYFSSKKQIYDFVTGFSSIPVVSISQELKGIHSILVDNATGIQNLLQHMIDMHSCKRFAFIGGPPGNSEAEERLNIFKKFIQDNGLILDEDLIIPGDFSFSSGSKAIRQLYKNPKTKIDAIITANDNMAWGALEELHSMQMTIPEDVLLGSFDDQALSKYMLPPLTTVRQPFYMQAFQGVVDLLSLIKKEIEPSKVTINTELIVRKSCGCHSFNYFSNIVKADQPETYQEPNPDINFSDLLLSKKDTIDEIKKQIVLSAEKNQIFSLPEKISYLIDAFFSALQKRQEKIFLDTFDSFLFHLHKPHTISKLIHKVLSIIRNCTIPYISHKEDLVFMEDILHQARIILCEHLERALGYNKIISELEVQHFREIGEQLLSILKLEDLLCLMLREFAHLGIKSFYFALYNDVDEKNIKDTTSQLIFAYTDGKEIFVPEGGIQFSTCQLLPASNLSIFPGDNL